MAITGVEVWPGMEVYDANGEKIGTVTEVSPGLPMDQAASRDVPTPPTGEGRFTVATGNLSNATSVELEVPFTAIAGLGAGDRVNLNCARDDCERLYARHDR